LAINVDTGEEPQMHPSLLPISDEGRRKLKETLKRIELL